MADAVMTTPDSGYWADFGSADYRDADHSHTIAVLPVGAIEQHGPHLPVGVDTFLLNAVLTRTLNRMPDNLSVRVLPTQSVGKSNEHVRFPGTLTHSVETLTQVWMEMGAAVSNAGIDKLLIYNSHGGQISLMDIVARDIRVAYELMVVSASWFSPGLPDRLFDAREQAHGIHAGAIETSMMLAVRPDLVDMSQAQDFMSLTETLVEDDFSIIGLGSGGARLAWQAQDLHPAGACGNATLATSALGEQLLDHAASKLIELLTEFARLPMSLLEQQPS